MSNPADPEDSEFEKRARALLNESVTHIDSRVRSRLNQARQAALAEMSETHGTVWRHRAIPMGLATAAAVTVVAVLVWHQRGLQPAPADATDMELIADSEAFELVEDDDAFYEWAISQETGS